MAEKRDNADILKEVCHLCRQNNFKDARQLILQAANISPEEKANVKSGEMGKYILNKCKNPNIQRMISVEKAFYGLWTLGKCDVDHDPSEKEVRTCINQLDEAIPFLGKEDKLYVKYWESYYYRYVSSDNESLRAELLEEVVAKTPKGKENPSSLFWDCALLINDLKIPLERKYDLLKSIDKKIDHEKPSYESFKAMLSKAAKGCFDFLGEKIRQTSDKDKTKCQYCQKAIDVADDLDLPEVRKNAQKLRLYGVLVPLQKQHQVPERFETYKKQQNLIYKQARLQKALGIHKNKGYDPYL